MFRRLSLKAKILVSYVIPLIGIAAVVWLGLNTAGQLSSMLGSMYDNNLIPIRDVANANMQAIYHNRGLYSYVIESDQKAMDEIAQKMTLYDSGIWSLIATYEQTKLTSEEITLLQKLKASWPPYMAAAKEVMELSYVGKNTEAMRAMHDKAIPAFQVSDDILSALVDLNAKLGKAADTTADEAFERTRIIQIVVSILVVAATLLGGWFLANMIARSITKVAGVLNESSSNVASASQQIASAAEELSQATTEQAASLEQTSSSIQEMNSMVGRNTDNAKTAADKSGASREGALRGKETVSRMIEAIGEINDANSQIMEQINESNARMAEIVSVINEIGNKTKVINDIVFQTKLLSFNASVEAARAGEHGKGFAVVAEEVGNLAQMSGNAAKEISSMLEGSIQKVDSIVSDTKAKVGAMIELGREKVEAGKRIATACGEDLEMIVGSILDVSTMAEEISAASREQALGVNEITKAINQLDQVTQQNAAATEEAASSAEALSDQADKLKAAVRDLLEAVQGAGHSHDGFTGSAGYTPKSTKFKAVIGGASTKKAAVTPAASVKSPKVIPIKAAKDIKPPASVNAPSKAANDDHFLPDPSDSRFEDI